MNKDSRMKFWNDQMRRAENIQNTGVVADFFVVSFPREWPCRSSEKDGRDFPVVVSNNMLVFDA